MRTTIEIRDDLRRRALRLSAARGDWGLSRIVAAALETYLDLINHATRRQQTAALLKGSLPVAEGEAMRKRIARARKNA